MGLSSADSEGWSRYAPSCRLAMRNSHRPTSTTCLTESAQICSTADATVSWNYFSQFALQTQYGGPFNSCHHWRHDSSRPTTAASSVCSGSCESVILVHPCRRSSGWRCGDGLSCAPPLLLLDQNSPYFSKQRHACPLNSSSWRFVSNAEEAINLTDH